MVDSRPQASQTARASCKKIALAEAKEDDFQVQAHPEEENGHHQPTRQHEMSVDPAMASLELFNNIFSEAFDDANVDPRSNRLYITKE